MLSVLFQQIIRPSTAIAFSVVSVSMRVAHWLQRFNHPSLRIYLAVTREQKSVSNASRRSRSGAKGVIRRGFETAKPSAMAERFIRLLQPETSGNQTMST